MTPLAGPGRKASRKEPLYWSLAALFGLSLHAAVAAFYIWRPDTTPVDVPAAAPMVFELVMQVAAPAEQSVDVPPGPEQVEAVKTPVRPPEVVETKLPELPTVEKPAEVMVRKPVVAERPQPDREPDPEPEQPVEEVSDVSAPETTAPPSMNVANASDQLAAPMQGALSQQIIDAQQQWQSALQAHLERRKRSPRQSTRRQGMSTVTFTMDRDGRVLTVTLEQGSGVQLFDREALALIRRAEPLPRPPVEVQGDPLTLTLPIRFNM